MLSTVKDTSAERGTAVSRPVLPFTTGAVTSTDGTSIGYRRLGSGPGVILLSGGYLAAQHYTELATALSEAFTVFVPDRRGRGLSGPPGPRYGMARECEDLDALLVATGARLVFGHSSGGLIALQAALTQPAMRRLAVYEPALSMYGTIPMSWIPTFEREMDQGRPAAAIATFTKGVAASRGVAALPKWLLVALLRLHLRAQQRRVAPGEQSTAELIPLQRLDVQIFHEMATATGFADISADLLLMEGEKTPAPLRGAVDALQEAVPQARRITFPGVGHEAPLNGRGRPERVAAELRAFFGRAA